MQCKTNVKESKTIYIHKTHDGVKSQMQEESSKLGKRIRLENANIFYWLIQMSYAVVIEQSLQWFYFSTNFR